MCHRRASPLSCNNNNYYSSRATLEAKNNHKSTISYQQNHPVASSNTITYKMLTDRTLVYLLVALATFNQCLAATADSQDNQPRRQLNQNQHDLAIGNPHLGDTYNPDVSRRSADQAPSASEERELRELNQVVDTMSQLLNDEQQKPDRGADVVAQPAPATAAEIIQDNNNVPNQQVATNFEDRNAPEELMSESAIRQAIEELERIQQQERLAEAESKLSPVLARPPEQQNQSGNKPHQAAYEGLIDGPGDELVGDQLAVASQEAGRLLQRDTGKQMMADNNGGSQDRAQRSLPAGQPSPPTTEPAPNNQHQNQHQAQKFNQSNQSTVSPTQSSLFIGQLDSLASELGPALTNDFYNFHAESNSAERGLPMVQSESPPSAAQENQYHHHHQQQQLQQQQQQQQFAKQPSGNSLVPNYHSDLDAAAQTRNAVTRQEPSGLPFSQHDPNSIRFQPFTHQPNNLNAQGSRPIPVHAEQNPENLVQTFRQQTGTAASLLENNQQFPTSTLIPLTNPENFWRPTNNGNFQPDGNDLNSQNHNNRARSSQFAPLPPLPESRFQSLTPQNQFSQPAPSTRQSQHIHFTGHSFLSGQPQFPGPQQSVQFNSRDRPNTFPSTNPPLISVLSGSDTSAGNSVSWNPPATINPPAQASLFNQQFPTSTQTPSQPIVNRAESQQQNFFPAPSRGLPSPLFNAAFDGLPEDAPGANNNQPRQQNFRQQFPAPTGFSDMPETSTDNGLQSSPPQPITTTTQRSAQQFVSQPSTEREMADSELETTTRNLPNNQRFFSPNDLLSPTSTSSPPHTESPSRPQRVRDLQTTTLATITTPIPVATVPKNNTKKDDMVIYYYYYYDDNKNATVVAKNVSQPSSIPLDAAIEADGGIEDTPYMDDPAPLNGARISSSMQLSTPKTTSTTSTTTTLSPSSAPSSNNNINNNFETNLKLDSRLRASSGSARVPPTTTAESSTRSSQFDRDFNELQDLGLNQFQNDRQRTTPSSASRASSIQNSRKPELGSAITPTPNIVPSTLSARPHSRAQSTGVNLEANTNRFASSDLTNQRTQLPSTRPQHSRSEPATIQHHSHNAISPVSSARSQKDLIQGVLNGQPNAQSRQPFSLSTTSAPIPSSTTHSSSRGPLSNASRYGMSTNLLLDPYGLDPSAPATSAHSTVADASGSHKNWPQGTASHSGSSTSQQAHRKPTAVTDIPNAAHSPPSTERNHGNARTTSQHFSPQRNQNNLTTPSQLVGSRVSQASTTQSNNRPTGSTLPSVASTPSRQLFPEAGDTAYQIGTIDSLPRVSTQSSRHHNSLETSSAPTIGSRQHIQRSQTLPASSSNFVNNNKLALSTEEPLQRLNNGRPSTSDGNTGNGFTRSPLQISDPTIAPAITPTNNQRSQQNIAMERTTLTTSDQVFSTQPTVSTSSSSPSTLSQQPSVVTSISQPTISTSADPIITTFSTSQASSSSSASASDAPTSPQTTLASTPQTGATSSTSAPAESNQSTENPDSAGSIARRKFGNRTNRFQTRLSSLSSSSSRSTTSTTTTQAPSVTSTTRRPTTSTTRRSSKQLFAGRRRLSSFGSSENSSQPVSSTAAPSSQDGGAAANSSLVETPTFSTSSSVSVSTSTTFSSSVSSSPASRTRFGNNFTSRSRTTSPALAQATNQSEQSVSTPKPTLFGAQRGTTKPRLPFLKPNKPSLTITSTESTSSLAEGTLSMGGSVEATLPTTERSNNSETSEGSSQETNSSPSGSTNVESGEKKETSPAPEPETAITTTVSSASQDSNGRKPRVRPLFASRQRNTSLFGNRRSASASNTTTTT